MVKSQFWEKWSTSYYQTLVKYHKWKLRTRNAEEGDVVLILDKKNSQGSFLIGLISRVKVDEDGIVRKVTVRYRLPKSDENVPRQFKYVERNVRGLALVMTAQEKNKFEEQMIDDRRFDDVISNVSSDDEDDAVEPVQVNPDEEAEENPSLENVFDPSLHSIREEEQEVDETVEAEAQASDVDARIPLEPSSSGRKRYLPSRLNL